MSVVFVSYIDQSGKKVANRFYIADDEDELDFLDRVKFYLVSLNQSGCHVLRAEVT